MEYVADEPVTAGGGDARDGDVGTNVVDEAVASVTDVTDSSGADTRLQRALVRP